MLQPGCILYSSSRVVATDNDKPSRCGGVEHLLEVLPSFA
jgi:hypothetical protein